MKTFASVAVLSMMLAGTAFAAEDAAGKMDHSQSSNIQADVDAKEKADATMDLKTDDDMVRDQQAASGSAASGTDGSASSGMGSEQSAATSDSGSAGSAGMGADQSAATSGAGASGSTGMSTDTSASTPSATGSTTAGSSAGGSASAGTASEGATGTAGSTATTSGGEKRSSLEQDGQAQAQAGGGDWHENAAIVRHLQTQLKEDGYAVGPVDGIYGPQTRQALQAYQQDQGLPVTGEIDRDLLAGMAIDADGQTAASPPEAQLETERTGPGGMEHPLKADSTEGIGTDQPGQPKAGFR